MANKTKRQSGITHRVFLAFLGVSFFALAYINLTSQENLRLVAEQFPEVNISLRKAFVEGYKMSMSLAVFFADIILVGPFSWLSYFSDHISPKRTQAMRNVSFFDLGILLATDFTLAVIAFNFTIVNAVDKNPVKIIDSAFLWVVTAAGFAVCLVASLFKIYSYNSDQRKALKNYIIKF